MAFPSFDKFFDVDTIPYICKVAKNLENVLNETEVSNAANPLEAIRNISNKFFYMPVDVYSDNSSYTVHVCVSGIAKADTKVMVTGKAIVVSMDRHDTIEGDGKYHTKEIPRGYFTRTIDLPVDADLDTIKATQSDGILRIVVKKVKSETNVRQVPIA